MEKRHNNEQENRTFTDVHFGARFRVTDLHVRTWDLKFGFDRNGIEYLNAFFSVVIIKMQCRG
jgi:hypothetical protein